MFRHSIRLALAVLVLATPLALAPTAEAHDRWRPEVFPAVRAYRVLYRDCSHQPWVIYGRFHCHEEAARAAHRLQESGYQVRIVHPW